MKINEIFFGHFLCLTQRHAFPTTLPGSPFLPLYRAIGSTLTSMDICQVSWPFSAWCLQKQFAHVRFYALLENCFLPVFPWNAHSFPLPLGLPHLLPNDRKSPGRCWLGACWIQWSWTHVLRLTMSQKLNAFFSLMKNNQCPLSVWIFLGSPGPWISIPWMLGTATFSHWASSTRLTKQLGVGGDGVRFIFVAVNFLTVPIALILIH